jgi:hypothetical protein
MQVGDDRFDVDQIQQLYESDDFPRKKKKS